MRRRMVERLIESGVRDERVLAALESIPRHWLVPEALQAQAYKDSALPIGGGQTISAPSTVAMMSEAIGLRGDECVLEIGTGSGYQASVLGALAERVVSIERLPRLAAEARRALDRLGVGNVVVHLGDGTLGRPAEAPYDAIVITAGAPAVPEPLLEQLAPGGRLVAPIGPREGQRLVRIDRGSDGRFTREVLGPCRFVDLVGRHGWAA